MNPQGWVRVRRAGVRWDVREGRECELPDLSGAIWPPPGTTAVTEKKTRTVWRIPGANGRPALYLKRFRGGLCGDSVKALIFGTLARLERDRLLSVESLGLRAAVPVATGERGGVCGIGAETFLLTEEVANAVSLKERLAVADASEREALRRGFVRMLKTLADAGFVHMDPHPDNILVARPDGASPASLVLFDLGPGRFLRFRPRGMFPAPVLRMLAWAAEVYRRHLSPADRWASLSEFYAREIAEAPAKDRRRLLWRLARTVARLSREARSAHIEKRAGRVLRSGSDFVREKRPGFRIFRRREYPAEAILEAVRRHEAAPAEGAAVLKDTHRTRVTRVPGAPPLPREVLVKEKKLPGSLRRSLFYFFSYSPRLVAWVNSRRLELHGVAVPRSIGYVRTASLSTGRPRQYILEEFLAAEAADAFAHRTLRGARGTPAGRRSFLEAMGRYLRFLHDEGIFHLDLKGSNFLVEQGADGSWKFFLIDVGRVEFGPLSCAMRAFNIGQVYASFLGLFSRTEFLRGFKAYWRGDERSDAARDFLIEAIRVQRGRGSAYLAIPE